MQIFHDYNRQYKDFYFNFFTTEPILDLRSMLSQNTVTSRIMALQLDETIKRNLVTKFKNIDLNPYDKFPEILRILKEKILNASIASNILSVLSNNAENIPIMLVQNLPIDKELIDTPLFDGIHQNKDKISELSLLLLSTALAAFPYVNEDEKSNSIIQNVIPFPGKEQELSGAGSATTFNWHTENVHEKNPADYLILLALRGDQNAYTSFMLVEDIVNGLPKELLRELLTTVFLMKTGPSYNKERSIVKPILEVEKNGNYNIYYNSDITRCSPITRRGKELYCYLQNYLEHNVPYYRISLRAGEAVIINNKKALHKRDGFKISTSLTERRWLQRIYLKR